jgi:predicted DNA-binding transcriptional regulator YafY
VSRAQRLLDLLQLLRCHRYPVRGAALAESLGITLRTLYRDIGALRSQGARIEGEPGVGFLLRPGFTLPPLAFTEEEVEALALGARWVANRADAHLADAARNAVAKIRAVLPPERRVALEESALLVGPGDPIRTGDERLGEMRQAIRAERKLVITYRDQEERESVRTVWPFALAFFDRTRYLVAWCELRDAFRHFRTDRVASLTALAVRYPRARRALLREWRETTRMPARAADEI